MHSSKHINRQSSILHALSIKLFIPFECSLLEITALIAFDSCPLCLMLVGCCEYSTAKKQSLLLRQKIGITFHKILVASYYFTAIKHSSIA